MLRTDDLPVRRAESQIEKDAATDLRRLRVVLGFFIFGLVISGVTAFPLQREMEWATAIRGTAGIGPGEAQNDLELWLLTTRDGLKDTYARYPWVGYGTDWLAFAHIIIALFFVGPWRDPRRNIWVLQAGLIACASVIPLALICGAVRGIPIGWRMLDCSFGVFGSLPLWYCLRVAWRLEDQLPSQR